MISHKAAFSLSLSIQLVTYKQHNSFLINNFLLFFDLLIQQLGVCVYMCEFIISLSLLLACFFRLLLCTPLFFVEFGKELSNFN